MLNAHAKSFRIRTENLLTLTGVKHDRVVNEPATIKFSFSNTKN